MIDWNNNGKVEPIEVVLTDIILSEEGDSHDESDSLQEDESPNKSETWFARLFKGKRG